MNAANSNLAEAKTLLAGMAKEAADLKQTMGGSITDAVADWLAPQYLLAAREKLGGADGTRRWEILRAIVQDWTVLRRGDHSAARLQLDREELDLQRANSQTQKEKEFWEWAKDPEIQAKIYHVVKLSPEEKERRIREILGISDDYRRPERPNTDCGEPSPSASGSVARSLESPVEGVDPTKSNQIKPNQTGL